MTASGTSRAVPILAAVSASAGVCPYLLAADGTWRASGTSRDHRCTAVAPSAIVAPNKQKRLCLVADHESCSTFVAAANGDVTDPSAQPRRRSLRRPVTRTTPLVLDHPRFDLPIPSLQARGVGQSGLVALMVVAFGAVALTRLGGPQIGPAIVAAPSGSPTAQGSPAATGTTPAATPARPTRTLVPSDVEHSPTPRPTARPATPGVGNTYTVRSGDTLSGIAARNGTTWKAIAQLNQIKDPKKIRVGQVLRLP
jgi:LysM repeat protein